MKRLLALALVPALALFAACGSTHGSDFSGGNGAGGNGDSDGGTVGGDGGALSGTDGGTGGTSPTDAPGEVFGHSDSTLYKLDPTTNIVTKIGDFSCIDEICGGSGMWDIALDKDGNMYGSLDVQDCSGGGSEHGSLVKIDKTNATCTIVKASGGTLPNSLSFVPAGTIDPTNEVLVGYDGADYKRIDPATGNATKIGSLNPNSTGSDWYSSGDIVSIIAGKTYLTATTDSSGSGGSSDSILEVDPVTGKALTVIGTVGAGKIWGLGFWGGTAYGFDAAGQLLSIDLTTGAGTPIPLTSSFGALSFYGAGNTTAAPLTPPR
ncbi:MAG TPA: hypothetical protein VF407_07630 [Polyangiaceae bacterium]